MARIFILLHLLFHTLFGDLILTNGVEHYKQFKINYLYDKENQLTFQEIQSKEFKNEITNNFTLGYHDGTVWFKIVVLNNSTNDQFVLHFSEAIWDTFDLYKQQDGKWVKENNGLSTPLNLRKVKDIHPAFQIVIPQGQSAVYYIEAKTIASQIGSFEISTHDGYYNPTVITSTHYYLIFSFVLLAILILNIYSFILTKEKIYIYYICYNFAFIVFSIMHSGLYLLVGFDGWNEGLHVVGAIVILSMALFTDRFLKLKIYLPTIHKFFQISTWVFLVFAIIINFNLPYVTLIFNLYSAFFFIVLSFSAFLVLQKGYIDAKYYLIALLNYAPLMTLMILVFNALIPYNNFNRHSFLLGAFLEILLFTIILAGKYRNIMKEKIRLQEELIKTKSITQEQLQKDVQDRTLELESQKTRYFNLIEYASDGIVILDYDGRIYEWNERAKINLGYDDHEMSIITLVDLDPAMSEEEIKAKLKSFTQKPVVFNTTHKRKDGTTYIAEITASTIMLDGKQYIYSSFRNVDDKITQEITLKHQKEEFETIFKTAKDGIAILDLTSKFLEFNDAYLKMTRFTREELLTKSCIELTIPEDIEKSKKVIETVLSNGYVENFEKSCLIKDNQVIIINMSLSLMPDKQRILITAKNMTEIKFLESQAKLISMGEMIGNIAHQWRQPLSLISTIASGISFKKEFGSYDDKDLVENMDQIVLQTQYLSKTIDDFRDFIKGENNEEVIFAKRLLEHTLNIVKANLNNCYIDVIEDIDDRVHFVGYENDLVQAFINIINNSKDALGCDEKTTKKYLFISAKTDNGKCEITIKDNAGGIDPSVIGRIFEPYFTTKHKALGTGLGLSMTHKIITEIHKGTITASNVTYKHEGIEYMGAQFRIVI